MDKWHREQKKLFTNDSKIVCQTSVPNGSALIGRVGWYACVDLIDENCQYGTYCSCRKFQNHIHIQRYRWTHIRRVFPIFRANYGWDGASQKLQEGHKSKMVLSRPNPIVIYLFYAFFINSEISFIWLLYYSISIQNWNLELLWLLIFI